MAKVAEQLSFFARLLLIKFGKEVAHRQGHFDF
jgi:hypothetical protein